MNAGDKSGARLPGAWQAAAVAVRDTLRTLFDVRLRSMVTPRLAPVIYAVLVGGVAGIDLYCGILAFDRSRGFGLLWLLMTPALFTAGVIAVRVGLELILSVIRIAVKMELLGEQLRHVGEQTETIAADLPRIQFWRSRERRLSAANGKNEQANTERREKIRS